MIRFLGILDILTGLCLILLKFGLSHVFILFFLAYLLIKSVIFFYDILSILDIIIVIIAGIAYFSGNLTFLLMPGGVYLIGKGFYSLI